MKYIKVSYLDLRTIPEKYTFFLGLNEDGSVHYGAGVSKDNINKYDDPRDPTNSLWDWLKSKGNKFSQEEVKKYKISRDEFMVALHKVILGQRKR